MRKGRKTQGLRKRPKRAAGGRAQLPVQLQMLLDPSGSSLTPGFHGSSEGPLSRVKESFAKIGGGTDTAGYLIWFPEYVTSIVNGSYNLVGYKTINSGTPPPNTTTSPFGEANADESYFTGDTYPDRSNHFYDPGASLIADDLVASMRTISAAISVSYTGKQDDASGEICAITDVGAQDLLFGGSAGGPASVDDFFQRSDSIDRLGTTTLEVVHRPSEGSKVFRDGNHLGPYAPGVATAVVGTLTDMGKTEGLRGFGIAWRGLDAAAANPMSFNLVKNIEWRVGATHNLSHPKAVHQIGRPLSDSAAAIMDAHIPGWNRRQKQTGGFGKMVQHMGSYAKTPEGKRLAEALLNEGRRLANIHMGY